MEIPASKITLILAASFWGFCGWFDSSAYSAGVDNLAQTAYIKASNTNPGDYFGRAVAICGDTMVIGAEAEESASGIINGDQTNNSAPGAGAVYVYVRSGNTCVQEAYLKASNAEENDRFGRTVAIEGDTIVVGAPNEGSSATGINGNPADNGRPYSGAAYVFVRSNGIWTQQAYLKAFNTGEADIFGCSVGISGNRIVIGASQESSAATGVNGDEQNNDAYRSGAAYVFERNGTLWTQTAYLKASNTNASDNFGEAVAVSGDTIVVSAPREKSTAAGIDGDQNDNSGNNVGAAYLFRLQGGQWVQTTYLKPHNPALIELFGVRMSLDQNTLIVSGAYESSDAIGVNGTQSGLRPYSGAAYVFQSENDTWSQTAHLKASNPDASDYFGMDVAIAGDLILVGAPLEDSVARGINGDQLDNTGSNTGAAYLFGRATGQWTQLAYLKASNASVDFGRRVAISGYSWLVGAPSEGSAAMGIDGDQSDTSASMAGAAYFFEGTSRSTVVQLPPAVKIHGKKTLRTVKAKITLKGFATDPNHNAIRVEVLDQRKKGQRKYQVAKGVALWTYQARLMPGKNIIKVRAIDSTGLYSPVARVTVEKR